VQEPIVLAEDLDLVPAIEATDLVGTVIVWSV
jgi:hypothetical protein